MGKRFKAAVIGGSGYGAAEMLRRLLLHPQVEVARVASIDHVGEPVWAAHPHLTGLTDLVFENITPRQAAQGCDVALLALPHKVTAAKVPELVELGVKIVNMSGDFRLTDAAAYKRYYGADHPVPELLGKFVYGLPELNREKIRAARWVASPGCFATCIELALLPLARAGLISAQTAGPIHVTGITGSSGSGAAPSAGTHHPERAVTLRSYKPLDHQHTPEIVEALRAAGGGDVELRFVPVSAPLSRGILASAFVEVDAAVDEQRLAALFDESYKGEPFVRRPPRRLPEVAAVSGSNYVEVGFAVGEVRAGKRTVTCFGALDNLIKGGAGQAIQNMNLVLGLDERLSLEDAGRLAVSSGARTIVVKLGGELVKSIYPIAVDIAALSARGDRVLVVHGGGPQATALQQALGQQPNIVGGRRITDTATLEVMKMTVGGAVNIDVCAGLLAAGARPVGLHGASALVVEAVKRPPRVVSGGGPEPIDFGWVGDVTGCNHELLALLLDQGYVPVLACLGAHRDGTVLNINADTVANQVARAVGARNLVLCTSTRGVLRSLADASSRIARLTIAEARTAIAEGTVSGGMIPKLEESLALCEAGVGSVHIVGQLVAGELAREIDEPGSVGTALSR